MTASVRPADHAAMAICALLVAGLCGFTAAIAARDGGMPLSALGAYFDGHLYLEIARSFPLPFAPGAIDYTGHAPGYPFAVWLLRAPLPNALFDWGLVLLLVAWIPAGLCAAVFYAICRELGAPVLWPTLLFAVANPRMLAVSATAHAEPIAILFALLALLAFLRGHLVLCIVGITFAGFARFAAFTLLAPLALGIVLRHGLRARDIGLLAIPPALFGLYAWYLDIRVPGFVSLAESHRVFWETHFTWPFRALIRSFDATLWSKSHPAFELTYATVALYLASLVTGTVFALRSARAELWVLTGWVAIVFGLHVSLSGVLGAWDFIRLTALAWPAAIAIFAIAVGREAPRAPVAALTIALALGGVFFARVQIAEAVGWQRHTQAWFLLDTIESLQSDEPRWADFRGAARRGARRSGTDGN